MLAVGLGLTHNAAANPWDSLPPGFRYFLATVFAVGETPALAQSAPGAGDRILDARIDLLLHGSIVSPANSHVLILRGWNLFVVLPAPLFRHDGDLLSQLC